MTDTIHVRLIEVNRCLECGEQYELEGTNDPDKRRCDDCYDELRARYVRNTLGIRGSLWDADPKVAQI